MGLIMKKIFAILLCIMLFASLAGCSTKTVSDQASNLKKLCKVWGFAKYTHPAFLTGEMCWDEELFSLIPIIYSANDGDVNDILYDWFVSLGDDGYDNYRIVFVEVRANKPWSIWFTFVELLNEIQWLSLISLSIHSESIAFYAQIDEGKHQCLKELFWVYSFEIIDENDINFRQMADLSWINESSLGLPLYERLSRFQAIQPSGRTNAPVSFGRAIGNSGFPNKQSHENMDYSDVRYRLLGLFRMWNAMEYYFPYRDILDRDWHELLLEYIPKMMEGVCRNSYELTLASLSMHLHDVHVTFRGSIFMSERFGQFFVPVRLTEAEGRLVVRENISAINGEFLSGDIIFRLNGTDINEVTADMLQFLSFPNKEKALAYIAFYQGLMSHNQIADIDVLRGDTILSLQIETTDESIIWQSTPIQSNILFTESNIGLINPGHLSHDFEIHGIMRDFAGTDGLIIDLRQYPWHAAIYMLWDYILYDTQNFAIISVPSQSVPGVFMDQFSNEYVGPDASRRLQFGTYFYDRPVVLLMDEQTFSAGEYLVMMLRIGPNVTVMGSNSIGADGNIAMLPLPGGIVMTFTGLGVYTLEGDQTQRIGLFPDIHVDRTIQGITEGRDELMEAAIAFLLGLVGDS